MKKHMGLRTSSHTPGWSHLLASNLKTLVHCSSYIARSNVAPQILL
jgi:hypothetical protein